MFLSVGASTEAKALHVCSVGSVSIRHAVVCVFLAFLKITISPLSLLQEAAVVMVGTAGGVPWRVTSGNHSSQSTGSGTPAVGWGRPTRDTKDSRVASAVISSPPLRPTY